MPTDGVRTIVRWKGNAKMVRFEDDRLAASCERLQAEEPARTVGPVVDFPPGSYVVESRTTMPGGFWHVRLDPERGAHVGVHNCPARAENPRADYPCIHIAAAWLCWKAEHDARDPFIQRLTEQQMSETSTALAPYQGNAQLTTYHVPSRQEISDTLALGKVLMETRGAAIPKALDTPQKAAAVILAGRELGFDPMTSFRHLYIVDGQTQPDGQALAALMQKGGGDLIYHCDCEKCADVELVRPGRPSVRVKYTMEQAVKAGNSGKYAWKNHPADMLIWKAVARLARRGAADLVNAVHSSMVRLDDFYDADHHVDITDVQEATEARLLTNSEGQPVDTETGEVLDGEHREVMDEGESEWPEDVAEAAITEDVAAADDAWRTVGYADAMANKGHYAVELNTFLAALGRHPRPDGYEDMTLGEIVTKAQQPAQAGA